MVNFAVNENKEMVKAEGITHIAAETFSFHELADAANNFRSDYLLGEGGFGRVYRGRLERTNQVCQHYQGFYYYQKFQHKRHILTFESQPKPFGLDNYY